MPHDIHEPERRTEKKWITRFFDSAAARNGGVIRQNVKEVLKHGNREELQDAVYDRCFHMIETPEQFIVICSTDPIKVYC